MGNIWFITCALFLPTVLGWADIHEYCPKDFFLEGLKCYHWSNQSYTKAEGKNYCANKTNGQGSLSFIYKRGGFDFIAENIYRNQDIKWDGDDEAAKITISHENGEIIKKGGTNETRALCEMKRKERPSCPKGTCSSISLPLTLLCIPCVDENSSFDNFGLNFYKDGKIDLMRVIDEELTKVIRLIDESSLVVDKKEEKYYFVHFLDSQDWFSYSSLLFIKEVSDNYDKWTLKWLTDSIVAIYEKGKPVRLVRANKTIITESYRYRHLLKDVNPEMFRYLHDEERGLLYAVASPSTVSTVIDYSEHPTGLKNTDEIELEEVTVRTSVGGSQVEEVTVRKSAGRSQVEAINWRRTVPGS